MRNEEENERHLDIRVLQMLPHVFFDTVQGYKKNNANSCAEWHSMNKQ